MITCHGLSRLVFNNGSIECWMTSVCTALELTVTVRATLPDECSLIVAPLTMGDANQVTVTRVVDGLSFCLFPFVLGD